MSEPVSLESGAGAMGLEDIEFDGEALRHPVDVQLMASDVEAGDRPWKSGALDQCQEPALQFRASENRLPVELDGTEETAVRGVSSCAIEQRLDLAEVEQSQLFGPLDGSVQLRSASVDSEVEQRTRERGKGDPLFEGAVPGGQAPCVVDRDRRAGPARNRRRYLERERTAT
jgi:hypothetical protein